MTVEGMDEPHAQAIVECRTHTGHFRTWEELQQAAGLTDELMSNLQHAARIGGTETIGGRDAENAPAREPERR